MHLLEVVTQYHQRGCTVTGYSCPKNDHEGQSEQQQKTMNNKDENSMTVWMNGVTLHSSRWLKDSQYPLRFVIISYYLKGQHPDHLCLHIFKCVVNVRLWRDLSRARQCIWCLSRTSRYSAQIFICSLAYLFQLLAAFYVGWEHFVWVLGMLTSSLLLRLEGGFYILQSNIPKSVAWVLNNPVRFMQKNMMIWADEMDAISIRGKTANADVMWIGSSFIPATCVC